VKDEVEAAAVSLAYILEQGARGSHVLFENDEIRHAFVRMGQTPSFDASCLDGVQDLVRHLAALPTLDQKRQLIENLAEPERDLLILLYFQFLDRFLAGRRPTLQ
jgi:hypothetical protein